MIEITNIEDIKGIKGLSPEEQECLISIDPETHKVQIYCSSNRYLTKLKRMLEKDSNYKCFLNSTCNGNPTSYIFECPEKGVSFRATNKAHKALTDEQREAARLRLNTIKENKVS